MSDITLLSLRPGLPQDTPPGPAEEPHKKLPKRYTEALHIAVVRLIQSGQEPAIAASASGLPKQDYYGWLSDVRAGNAHPKIVQFAEDCERAYDLAEVAYVDTITNDPKTPAENAKWMLERTRSKGYGLKITTIVQQELSAAVDRVALEFQNEPLLLERALKALSSGTE